MRQIDTNLWVVERPLRFVGGVELGARMTVVRLADGSLFLHSPVALDDALRAELQALGTPRYVVAPNRFHHLFAGAYRDVFPECRLYVAPGLPEKRPDLHYAAVLPAEASTPWLGEIDQELFAGLPMMNEVVFLHRASRTLLVCDLAFHLGPEAPWLTRVCFRLVGGYDRFGPTVVERLLIRDRVAARASLERILAWDFDRVIVAHGKILEQGGREGMRRGYSWLMAS